MQLRQKITREKFFKVLSYALIIPLVYGWISMLKQNRFLHSKSETLVLPANLPDGLSFFQPVIINKKPDGIEIFSARCTHLGCMINHIKNDRLVCPCHGSEYLSDGSVIKGPSKEPLRKLNYTFDREKEAIIVKLV
jgi:Rieske Fe-S protein